MPARGNVNSACWLCILYIPPPYRAGTLSFLVARSLTDQVRAWHADGLTSVADDNFRASFMDVYSAPSLAGIPWYAVSRSWMLAITWRRTLIQSGPVPNLGFHHQPCNESSQ